MHLIQYLTVFSAAIAFVNCYKATVVEHIPESLDTPETTIARNLRLYITSIENAKKSGSDIIVFPEYGLTHMLNKDQYEKYAIQIKAKLNNEMEEGHLRTLSNSAKENNIYVVVNFIEKEFAAKNVVKLYNTNVVFNRKGDIVAKYRKINLYNEEGLTPGNEGNVTFTTDFGVKFGIFTCFDILFYNPSRLILESNVTDIIYPTAWFSFLPIYVSTAIQYGYVKSAGVNLLAANLNLPTKGASGSGIYEATGEIKKIEINGASKSIDVVSTVTEHPKQLDSCDVNPDDEFKTFSLIPDEDDPNELNKLEIQMHSEANKYKYAALDLSSKDIHKEICSGSFCCTFNIKVNNYVKGEYFKLAAHRDTVKNKDISLCLLVHCANGDNESCGSRSKSNTTFSRIEVFGEFKRNNYVLYQPYGLKYDYKPIESLYYCNKEFKETAVVKLSTNATKDLIAIGLMAGSGNMVMFNIFLMFTVIYNILMNLISN